MINALNPDAVKVTPRGREMFDTAMWDKLDATPFARYSGAEMQVFKRPAQPIEGCPVRAFNSTTIHLDHYKYVMRLQKFAGGFGASQHRGAQVAHFEQMC